MQWECCCRIMWWSIAKENDELKQEVERLMKDLYRLKGKDIESNVQPSQDNREYMVKKLEKGSTATCSKCHKEDHKSNKCPQPRKKLPDEKNKKKLTIKSSLIYTKPNRRNKSNSTSYGKAVAHMVGKKERSWNHSIWVPRTSSPTWKGLKWCGFQRKLKAKNSYGVFGGLA